MRVAGPCEAAQAERRQHERHDHPDDPDAERRSALAPRRRDIDLEAGLEQQEQHAEPGHRLEHRVLNGVDREDRLLQLGQRAPEEGGAEQHADQDREGNPRKARGVESDETKQLRKQLRDVTEERDILKKALAYFADDQK